MAYGSAGHQLARSDHPGLYESAVGEVCCFKTFCSDHPGLYESAVGKVCRSDHPGLDQSAVGKVCWLRWLHGRMRLQLMFSLYPKDVI